MIRKKSLIGYFGSISNDLYGQHTKDYEKANFTRLGCYLSDSGAKYNAMVFPLQSHSNHVVHLDDLSDLSAYSIHECHGDAVITHLENIAIGIATADCVPIILYDHITPAIAVIHAGWRGISSKIVSKTVAAMRRAYQSSPCDLSVFVGPAAKACCYEVQPDFVNNFANHDNHGRYFTYKGSKLFFNAKLALTDEFIENEIRLEQVDFSEHVCTICTKQYCSFRRDHKAAGRQPTVAVLNTL